jgi:hypothetical protein
VVTWDLSLQKLISIWIQFQLMEQTLWLNKVAKISTVLRQVYQKPTQLALMILLIAQLIKKELKLKLIFSKITSKIMHMFLKCMLVTHHNLSKLFLILDQLTLGSSMIMFIFQMVLQKKEVSFLNNQTHSLIHLRKRKFSLDLEI